MGVKAAIKKCVEKWSAFRPVLRPVVLSNRGKHVIFLLELREGDRYETTELPFVVFNECIVESRMQI